MLKVTKGTDELQVKFPSGGHVNKETIRMYDDRCDLRDKPESEKELKAAYKVVQLYSLFSF